MCNEEVDVGRWTSRKLLHKNTMKISLLRFNLNLNLNLKEANGK